MIYLVARYYDPNDGRFITEDTYKGQVDNPLSLNRYTYVYNNPYRYKDPTGHDPDPLEEAWFGQIGIKKYRPYLGQYLENLPIRKLFEHNMNILRNIFMPGRSPFGIPLPIP
ncbi:RHS repeat-associated core domain-containing protein [Brevibacillus laterosporus]|nr:RHS repeat-associated core domain-containing protein [Brevibacillus laterosporus]MED1664848.1 RHS repeat-associated core domain-containing protein [Brevibacillus laterosporus]MED1671430.1 RHS repeat-associated core domain-containing protein [Brevibacillus laterosporus]MED1717540.1 RHS repeat-associated core domain-containing protein [Brevibacillus laterosporus]